MTSNQWKLGNMKWAKRLVLSIAVVTLAMVGQLWFDAVRAENAEISGPPIPYDHLASQESDPFLFLGYIMDDEMTRWPQYRRAIMRFPDVRDCLAEEEREKEKPNLLRINWRHTGMGKGAEVCVFLIARSLGNVDRIRQWLEIHEFRLGPLTRTRTNTYRKNEPVSNMSAYWSVEQYREKNPSLLRTLTGFDMALGYEIVLQFSEINQIVGVAVVIPSK